MESKTSKRLCAYIIDILLVTMIFSLLTMFIPTSQNLIKLNAQVNELNNNLINNQVLTNSYVYQYASLTHMIDKELFLSNLFSLVLFLGYFSIVPFYLNGQTFGKKIMRIKIAKDNGELSMNDLIIRNIIINGLGYTLLSLALIFILPDLAYLIVNSILGFIQFLLVIISGFMILYRHDKKGLHDLVCKTKVINNLDEVKK